MSCASGYGRRRKYIQKRHRIKDFAFVLDSDMQMFTCTAACGACYADRKTGEDGLGLGDEDSGEVAVADAEVTVAEGDEVAGTRVVADFIYYAIEHGIDKGVMGSEVDAVV